MTRPTLKVEFYNAGFTDYATSCRRIIIDRGRERLLDRQRSASCIIDLDATVAYLDPTSGSALYGVGSFVVVSATGSGAARRMFSGWVTDVRTSFPNDAYPRVTFACSGPFDRLIGASFPTATFSGTVETDVDELMDAIVAYAIGGGADLGTWVLSGDGPGGTAHEIDATGDTFAVLTTLAAQGQGDLIEEFWNDPDKQVYRFIGPDRREGDSRFTFTDVSPSPPTSFPYDESSWMSGASIELVRNSVTVTANGLAAQTHEDATSIAAYGTREYSLATWQVSTLDAVGLAWDLVNRYKTPPAVDVRSIRLEPDAENDDDLWDLVIDVGYESASGNGPRLQDPVTVVRTGPNGAVSAECVLVGYRHEIYPQADGAWQTTLQFEPVEEAVVSTFTIVAKQNGSAVASTTNLAVYSVRGGFCAAHFSVDIDAAGTVGSEFKLTPTGLPAPATNAETGVGAAQYFASGTDEYHVGVIWNGTDLKFKMNKGGGNVLGVNPSFAATASDTINGFLLFPVA